MTGVDFTYTVGLDAKTDTLTKKVNAFRETLAGRPFDIKLDLKGFDTDKATQAFAQLGIEMDKIKTVTADVVTLVDKNGKIYQEAKGYTAQYADELGRMTTAYMKIPTTIGDTAKKTKEYDAILKSTADTLNRTQNVDEKHRQGIEKTADEIKNSISSWKQLAEQYGASSPQAKELETKITGLVSRLKEQEGATKTAANAMQNFGTRMANAIKQTFAYSLSMRAMRMAQGELNKAIRYTIDLNTEMTKIQVLQVEGAKTEEQINRLADSYNRLGKEMGASTLEVAKGSVEWLRQGKTVEETGKLLESTLMLSKLGNIDTAQATERLTSTLNGYALSAEHAISVVDKLIAVDNIAATSVDELTTAMQYSAAIASQTGVSMEQLISYIGIVSSTTRQNAESIGQGMKTILTRLQDIKAGAIDEDGLGINNVEIALKGTGVALRDSTGDFRDFGTVIEELAAKWEDLDGIQQAYISKAIAGVRQVNMFTVLMNEMGTALEFQEEQMNAAGMATDRYAIYMESLAAKQEQFKAELQGLYQGAIGKGTIGWFVDTGIAALKLVESLGGIAPLLPIIAAGIVTIKQKSTGLNQVFQAVFNVNRIKQVEAATARVAVAQEYLAERTRIAGRAFGASAKITQQRLADAKQALTNEEMALKKVELQAKLTGTAINLAFSLGIMAVGMLISHMVKLREEQKQALEDAKAFAEEWKKVGSLNIELDSKDRQSEAEELLTKYEELREIVNLTNIEASEFKEIQEGIIGIYPELRGLLDENYEIIKTGNGVLLTEEDILARILDIEKERKAISEEKLQADIVENMEGADKALREQYRLINDAISEARSAETPEDKAAWEETARERIRTYNDMLDGYAEYYEYAEKHSFTHLFAKDINKNLPGAIDYDSIYNIGTTIGEAILGGFRFSTTKIADDTLGTLIKVTNEAMQITSPTAVPTTSTPLAGSKSEDELSVLHQRIQAQVELNEKTESFVTALSKINGRAIKELSGEDLRVAGEKFGDLAGIVTENKDGILEFSMEAALSNEKIKDWHKGLVEAGIVTDDYTVFLEKLIERTKESANATEELADAHEELMSQTSELVSAMEEQGEQGYISKETALQIAESNGELFRSLIEVEGGYQLTQQAIDDQITTLKNSAAAIFADAAAGNYNATVKQFMAQASEYAALGNYALAMSAIESAEDALKEADAFKYLTEILKRLANIDLAMPTFQGGGISGGGSQGEDPRIKANEELIEQIEDQIELEEDKIDVYKEEIDLIKKAQDEYHDWIDQKKKSLELTKEESDYFKEQQKSLKELADIRKEIALLELDTSEEATAKRLELEAQAAEMEAEIAEDAEERRFDLQMEALDKLKDSFDKMIETQIEGIENVIKSIEDGIDILRDRIEDIRDLISDIRDEGRSGSSNGYQGGGYQGGGENGDTPVLDEAPNGVIVMVDGKPVLLPAGKMLQGPFEPGTSHWNQNSIDIAAPFGTSVGSPVTGELLGSGMSSAYGGWAAVGSKDNPHMVYHLDEESIKALTGLEGTIFEIGQEIGVSGNTGNVGAIPHVGNMAGASWDASMYNPETRMTNDRNAWAFRQPKEFGPQANKELINSWKTVAAYLDSGNLENAISFGAEGINKQIDLSSVDNKEAITTDLTDGFLSLDEATTNGLLELGDNVDTLTIKTEHGFINLIRSEKENVKGFAIVVQNAVTAVGKLVTKKDIVTKVYGPGAGAGNKPLPPKPGESVPLVVHSGGLIESHHDGNFAGNLQSNEVFAKLLKGEYVSTEGQMDNFLKNVLPKVTLGYQAITKNNQIPSITVNMPITVEGNMDKDVIPDIKKISNNVMEEINRSLILRGYVRPANNTLS